MVTVVVPPRSTTTSSELPKDEPVAAPIVEAPETPEGLVDGVLLPAATLSTHRLEVDLLDPQGRVLAQLCDDTVTALPAGSTWRELEVELTELELSVGAEILVSPAGCDLVVAVEPADHEQLLEELR